MSGFYPADEELARLLIGDNRLGGDLNGFGQALMEIRLELGHKTSKSFFAFLKERGLECNYAYYVKIEKGVAFPSVQIANQIAKAVDRGSGETLIRVFCSQQFESFDYLFKNKVKAKPKPDSEDQKLTLTQGQKELTVRQVDVLQKRKENYFLFLILTLARHPIPLKEVKRYASLANSQAELLEAGIIFESPDGLLATSPEFIFPRASLDKNLPAAYGLFDKWDLDFSSEFNFENHLNKMMIRRISPRYFGVMQKQIEAFVDFVRCSDESDPHHNNEVLHLHIRISKGDLPG